MLTSDTLAACLEALRWMQEDSRQVRLTHGNQEAERIFVRLDAAIAALQQPAPPIDMPNGPGWWAFEGKVHKLSKEYRSVGEVINIDGRMLYHLDGYGLCLVEYLIGKWYRLTMPWEQEQTAP